MRWTRCFIGVVLVRHALLPNRLESVSDAYSAPPLRVCFAATFRDGFVEERLLTDQCFDTKRSMVMTSRMEYDAGDEPCRKQVRFQQ